MKNTTFKKIAIYALTLGAGSLGTASAHTTFQTKTADENTTVYNNLVIGHGCHTAEGSPNKAVIANSVVFPDWSNAILKKGSTVVKESVSKYVEVNGFSPAMITHIPSKDVFEKAALKYGQAGFSAHTPVGISSWGGKLVGDDTAGLVPIRINKIKFKSNQCATSITFHVAVADICKYTKISGFTEHTVNFWTPTVGSNYDAPEANPDDSLAGEAATYKVVRTSALPVACGDGFELKVYPSAAQLNRDMPIPKKWPKN